MDELIGKKKCVPCSTDAPLATDVEIAEFLPQLPGWEIVEIDGMRRLTKVFVFKNFRQALHFTNLVGEAAEAEGHHPALLTEWGKVTVSWWTHKIGGLHLNDFIMAAKTEEIGNAPVSGGG